MLKVSGILLLQSCCNIVPKITTPLFPNLLHLVFTKPLCSFLVFSRYYFLKYETLLILGTLESWWLKHYAIKALSHQVTPSQFK